MSEVRERSQSFFQLYLAGSTEAAGIDGCIDAWHASGPAEKRSLGAYLGMTEDEYALWVMDTRILPVLRAARRAGEPLTSGVGRYVAQLRSADDIANGSAILALSSWLARRPSA